MMKGPRPLLGLVLLVPSYSLDAEAQHLFHDATAAFSDMRHAEAVKLLERLQQQTPAFERRHEADKLHGAALASMSRGEEALECWERAVAAFPSHKQGSREHAEFRDEVSQYVLRAAQVYHGNAEKSSGTPAEFSLRLSAGVLTSAVGKNELALTHLEAAVRLQPENPSGQLALGKQYASSSRPAEAQALLRSAMELAPRRPGCIAAYTMLAAVSCQLKDLAQCFESYVAAFEAASEEATAPGARAAGGDAWAAAALAVSSAAMVAIQRHGEAGLAEARALGQRGVASGVLQAPLQIPRHLHRGLRATAWWDDARERFRAVQLLEAHAADISAEVLRVFHATDGFRSLSTLESDSQDLVAEGSWSELNLWKNGQPQPANLQLLPRTSALIASLPEAISMVRGGAKVSIMSPGTQIASHSGLSNTRLRIHLGLSVPEGCGIVVNEEAPRTWVEGECLTFDDSFVHSVWQNGTAPRVVLIVDV